MRARPRSCLGIAAAAALVGGAPLAAAARWQAPPAPQAQQPQGQQPQGQQPQPATPVDPTKAAAEILRQRLGLKPGPAGLPPAGPPVAPPEQPPEPGVPANGAPAQPAAQGQEPGKQEPGKQEPGKQEPGKTDPPNPVIDPVKAAAEALKRLLPKATEPGSAPLPTASGTPEPLPGPSASVPPELVGLEPPALVDLPWSGTLSARYRYRHGGGTSDQDLVARLTLDVGRSEDPLSFHLAARGFGDLDGRKADDPFQGLDQSFGDRWNGRLYAAYADLRKLPRVDLLRLGRQDLDETPTPVSLDGVRAESERFGKARVWGGGYAGLPVHQFEASRQGDLVYGVDGGFAPWDGGRVRLDYMHLRDEWLSQARTDDLLGVRWWQNVGPVALHGLHTWRDGKPRDLYVRARGELDDATTLAIGWRELLTTQRAQVTELDPFYEVAFEYSPYRQLEASLSRELWQGFTAALGCDVRRLRDGGDATVFNREFERYYADVTWTGWGPKGLSVTLAGSQWDATDESFRTVTGELAYRPDRSLRLALGSGYDLFRYDLFDGRERVHVRSFYVHGEHQLSAAVRIDGGYDYERDEMDEFHVFRLGVAWKF